MINFIVVFLMYILKYSDTLPWAVWKQLNWSRCSLQWWVRWVQKTCITWGCRWCNGHFWGV